MASGNEVDAIYLDISKAFDKVPHHLLLRKLENLGIRGSLLSWFQNYLADRQQRVVLHGIYSDWLTVTSGLTQSSIYSDLCYFWSIVMTFKLTWKISTFALLAATTCSSHIYSCLLQYDLANLINWTADNQMELNDTKCKTMHISRKRTPTQTNYNVNGRVYLNKCRTSRILVYAYPTTYPGQDTSKLLHLRQVGLIKIICKEVNNMNTRGMDIVRIKLRLLDHWKCIRTGHEINFELS